MRFDANDQAKLWQSAGVTSIGQFPGFPFKTHTELVAAIRSGTVEVGLDYGAARQLMPSIKGRVGLGLFLLLTMVPLVAIPIASIWVTVAGGNLLYLVAILLGFLAYILASPYNPQHGLLFVVSLFTVAVPAIVWHSIEPRVWLPVAFGASFLAVRTINRVAWRWAYEAVLECEALAAVLWKTNSLYLRSEAFGHLSALSVDVERRPAG